jgi:hypothetical protein
VVVKVTSSSSSSSLLASSPHTITGYRARMS